MGETILKEVHDMYKKWLYVENTNRIDIGLAVKLIARTYGTRVWLLIVGASGDWKSEQVMALYNLDDSKIIRNFTSKTLVNGNPKIQDLAPMIRNKTIIFPDMAQILQLNPNEKGEVWGQLRDLYDGCAGKQSGLGKDIDYKDLNVTLIACSTPSIDKQILIHQDLGTRELIWRTIEDEEKCIELMQKVLENEENEALMRLELNQTTNNFLACHSYNKGIKIEPFIYNQLKVMARKLTYLRASADTDYFNGELLNQVCPEQPTRVLKQFKKIYIALKSLDPFYSDIDALEIINHLVESSSNRMREKVLNMFIENPEKELSTNKISEILKVGYKTSYSQLNILWNLGIFNRRAETNQYDKEKYYWKINFHHFLIKELLNLNIETAMAEELKVEEK